MRINMRQSMVPPNPRCTVMGADMGMESREDWIQRGFFCATVTSKSKCFLAGERSLRR